MKQRGRRGMGRCAAPWPALRSCPRSCGWWATAAAWTAGWTGLLLSGLALLVGGASAWHLLALWVLYHSINAVGQRWYSFGWESQLLETTLLALLAAPGGLLGCAAPGASLPAGAPPPVIAVWAFRWMAFRIMLGAGLIKVRGAKCWLDLTAMCHHLETQPIPNPLSRRFHNLPRSALLYATACNHVIELLAPWLILLPCRPALAAFGLLHVVFQATLILTGNLSFLNWLTIVPGLWCFDDATLVGLLPQEPAARLARSLRIASMSDPTAAFASWSSLLGLARDSAAVAIIVWLSVPVYRNLLGARGGGRQKMNAAFPRVVPVPLWCLRPLCLFMRGPGPAEAEGKMRRPEGLPPPPASSSASFDLRSLRLLNTYGAFGSVNRERVEIVFEGSREQVGRGEWHPYTFKAAVDDPMKRPGWLAPYHLRLDWCRWIASCRGRRSQGLEEQWALAFAGRLLMGDPGVRRLLGRGGDPFESGSPPARVRASLYVYCFAPPPASPAEPYWLREYVGPYLPPLRLRDLAPKLHEWGMVDESSPNQRAGW